MYDSGNIAHATTTNVNDTVLSAYQPTDIIPSTVIGALNTNAGLWFGDNDTSASNMLGALPYGNYKLEEMRTEATSQMVMLTRSFTINANLQIIDLGELVNVAIGLSTTLTDVADGDHYVAAGVPLTLADTVQYENLTPGRTYTLNAKLYRKVGTAIADAEITATKTFTPTTANGRVEVLLTVPGGITSGESLVCCETLTLNGEYVSEHSDQP